MPSSRAVFDASLQHRMTPQGAVVELRKVRSGREEVLRSLDKKTMTGAERVRRRVELQMQVEAIDKAIAVLSALGD